MGLKEQIKNALRSVWSHREPGGETSCWKRFIVTQALVYTFLMAGLVFGISSLQNVLVNELNAFSSLCSDDEELPCAAQKQQFTFVATAATSTVSMLSIVWGILLDKWGPRTTVCIGAFTQFCGFTAVALANDFGEYLYFCGFIAIASGGQPIFTATTNFCALFENQEALISVQSGAYQMSAAIFLILSKLQLYTGLTFSQVFLGYAIVPVTVFAASLCFFPDGVYKPGDNSLEKGEPYRLWTIWRFQEKTADEQASPAESKTDVEGQPELEAPLLFREESVPQTASLFNVNLSKQLMSLPFLLICAYTGAYILVVNFNIATMPNQLYWEFKNTPGALSADANKMSAYYTDLFSLLMPIGACAGALTNGIILVKFGLPTGILLQVSMTLLFLLFSFPHLMPLPLKLLGFFAFGVNRPLSLGCITTLLAIVFGFQNYGRLFGLSQLFASLATPIQWYLVVLVERVFNNRYHWINSGFVLLEFLIGITFPLYLVNHVLSGFFIRPKTPETLQHNLN